MNCARYRLDRPFIASYRPIHFYSVETISRLAFLRGIHPAALTPAGERGCLAPHGSGTCPAGLCGSDAPLLFCLTHNSWGGRPQRRRLLPESVEKKKENEPGPNAAHNRDREVHRPCETDWSTNKPETTHASSNSCLTRNRTCEPLVHTGGSGALPSLHLPANTHWQCRQLSEGMTCSFTSVRRTGRGHWRTGPETRLLVSHWAHVGAVALKWPLDVLIAHLKSECRLSLCEPSTKLPRLPVLKILWKISAFPNIVSKSEFQYCDDSAENTRCETRRLWQHYGLHSSHRTSSKMHIVFKVLNLLLRTVIV